MALLSLEARELMWGVQESLSSRIIPKYFTFVDNGRDLPFKKRDTFELHNFRSGLKNRVSVLVALIEILYEINYTDRLSRSMLRLDSSLLTFLSETRRLVSSSKEKSFRKPKGVGYVINVNKI